ncbi:penicillin-binding protein 2 [Nocardioides sp. HDW12B]|uniref:peptidoglycan D,D-transpeptidase FtsI family protein n=1 Tax=Nocardioides sp. HDW12B TaxID=2714939 RepID=UPI001409D2E1|nr:penicillin-binding protein 2 [Nocardioides sp. HDW12B]QIK67903.1 penicillin-binding protein 2 [Nocardioides sp. HDW12B]
MNTPIRRMSVLCLVLFLALLLNATWVQYVQAGSLNDRNDNRRVRDAEFSRERGAILVNGNPVAESVPVDDQFKYQRRYPQPLKYGHLTGFFSYIYGASGVESNQNTILSGSDSRFFVNRVVDTLSNKQPEGGSVSLTVDPAAQTAAFEGIQALGPDTKAAVVALEPSSGKILAMVSNPTYDPNKIATHDLEQSQTDYERLIEDPDKPMFNRAIQEVYPPGSTFKLVTAAAALESGDYDPDSQVDGRATYRLPDTSVDVPNDSGGSCGGGDRISLTLALQVSCNVAFLRLGNELGAEALSEQAEKFGFGQRYLSGLGAQAVSVFPDDLNDPNTALSAIGQFEVRASPLQMALVTATIANNGQGMRPYLVDEVRAPDLSVLEKTSEEEMPDRAMSSTSASLLTQMMVETVDQGTAAPAAIPDIKVAGKTGTAQSAADRNPYAWFVSFAPADNPEVAVAVLVQDAGVERDAISGGGLAAPIAKSVMEAVIQ